MKTNCYQCKHWENCEAIVQYNNCPSFELKDKLKKEKDVCNILVTVCYFCKCDIRVSEWPKRYAEWERLSKINPGVPPKKPHYLCENCYDRISAYSSNWWYKYICADENDKANWEGESNGYDNYWDIPKVYGYGNYKGSELTLLSKLKQLVVKYSGDFNTNKFPIVKVEDKCMGGNL